jgi:predicted alpha-1,6-mannanase (GH76 family)
MAPVRHRWGEASLKSRGQFLLSAAAVAAVTAVVAVSLGHTRGTAAWSARPAPTLEAGFATTFVSTPSTYVPSFTAADSDSALDSFLTTFYVVSGGRGVFKLTTTGSQAPFWQQAEMLEVAEDAYERSHDPRLKSMLTEVYRGIIARYGKRWTSNHYNDDIMWMVIADLRAYGITGNVTFRNQAKWHFDRVYARAWSRDLGGGLWWTTARDSKNACVNGPATIAAVELYEAFHDTSYLRKAKGLYQWEKNTLFDHDSGSVYDRTYRSGTAITKDDANYTYNQGTFIGAAGLLYAATHDRVYYRDAVKALDYTKANLTADGVLRSEGSGRDGGGFKDIFARWATKFTRDNNIRDYDEWFQRNADAAWSHRNATKTIDQDWTVQTGDGKLFAFDCSSAVVILLASPPAPAQTQAAASPNNALQAITGAIPIP